MPLGLRVLPWVGWCEFQQRGGLIESQVMAQCCHSAGLIGLVRMGRWGGAIGLPDTPALEIRFATAGAAPCPRLVRVRRWHRKLCLPFAPTLLIET